VSPRGDRPAGDRPEEERVDSVMRDVLGEPAMRGGIVLGRLVRSWEAVVGAKLALETAPWALQEGGLVVAASSPAWAAQVQFLAAEVRRRANLELGGEPVRSVRVIVRPEASKPLQRNQSDVSARGANLRPEDPAR
jgi:predicted nucleic acid-binding Zn ribbon protein